MDNAKYHNILADDTFPTISSRKHELKIWLANNYPGNELLTKQNVLKLELYELCKKLATPPTTATCRKLIKEVFLKEYQYWQEDAEADAKNILNEVETIENYFDVEESDF